MTSEIAVLNRQGVALAADSVATVRSGRPGTGGKPYPTGNKIFELSVADPVGVMVYASGDYTGIPWDTIVKMYRASSADRRQPTLAAYRDDFLAFLSEPGRFVSADTERDWLVRLARSRFKALGDAQRRELHKRLSSGTLTVPEVVDLGRRLRDEAVDAARLAPPLREPMPEATRAFQRTYGAALDQVAREEFGDLAADAAFRRQLRDLIAELLLRQQEVTARSGLVLAGFGRDELFPSVIQLEVDGSVLGRTRAWPVAEHSVGRHDPGVIVPFAETAMITTFLEGQHPAYETAVRVALTQLVDASWGVLSTAPGLKDRAALAEVREAATRQAVEAAVANLADFRAKRYKNRILTTLGNLPKEELAALAEALVSLTALSQRVTDVPESVGGPVDVALISKGDGMVWVKQKHYFDTATNPAYLWRHYPRSQGDA